MAWYLLGANFSSNSGGVYSWIPIYIENIMWVESSKISTHENKAIHSMQIFLLKCDKWPTIFLCPRIESGASSFCPFSVYLSVAKP